jgi:hypothetical protein
MLFFVVMNLENRIAPSREYLGAAKKLLVGLILSAVSWNFSAYATEQEDKEPVLELGGQHQQLLYVNDGWIEFMNLDFQERFRPFRGEHPVWSPDGSEFAYESFNGTAYYGISVFDFNTLKSREIDDEGSHPIWSFSGNYLVFQQGYDIISHDAKAGTNAKVAEGIVVQFIDDDAFLFRKGENIGIYDLKAAKEIKAPMPPDMVVSRDGNMMACLIRKGISSQLPEWFLIPESMHGKVIDRDYVGIVDMQKKTMKIVYVNEERAGMKSEIIMPPMYWSPDGQMLVFRGMDPKYPSKGPGDVKVEISNSIKIYNHRTGQVLLSNNDFPNLIDIDWGPDSDTLFLSMLKESGYYWKFDGKKGWAMIDPTRLTPEGIEEYEMPKEAIDYDIIMKWNTRTNMASFFQGHSLDVFGGSVQSNIQYATEKYKGSDSNSN